MRARSDGKGLPREALVDPDLCAGCGICAGACPSSTPFRSVTALATGIDMPQAPIDALRVELEAALARIAGLPRGAPGIVVFGCRGDDGIGALAHIADERTAVIALLCAAQLPPSFVEYALRAGADGVLVTGCRHGDCTYRLGNRWLEERLAALREPHLRVAVPRDRMRVAWTGCGDERALLAACGRFRADLAAGARARRPSTALPPKRASPPPHPESPP
jgi:coenzyme F420-reducing hydrogenase delta subunit